MYGATVAYYIYLILVIIMLIGTFVSVGAAALGGAAAGSLSGNPGTGFAAAGVVLLLMLPGLLFTGWIAFILGKCRKTIEIAAKMSAAQ